MSKLLLAAGCLVWRSKGGEVDDFEVLVVHRPEYDDWSFAKGKLEAGETELECALREVEEETNFSGVVGSELASVHYTDHKDRHKRVRYWSLEATAGTFVPNDEVDEVRWLGPEEAAALLSYPHDRELLSQFQALGNSAG